MFVFLRRKKNAETLAKLSRSGGLRGCRCRLRIFGAALAVPDLRLFRSSWLACPASHGVAWRSVPRLLAPCIHGARLRLPACCACRSSDGVRSLRTLIIIGACAFCLFGLYIIYNNTAVIFNKRQRYFMCSFNKSKKYEKMGLTCAGNRAIMEAQKKTAKRRRKNNGLHWD